MSNFGNKGLGKPVANGSGQPLPSEIDFTQLPQQPLSKEEGKQTQPIVLAGVLSDDVLAVLGMGDEENDAEAVEVDSSVSLKPPFTPPPTAPPPPLLDLPKSEPGAGYASSDMLVAPEESLASNDLLAAPQEPLSQDVIDELSALSGVGLPAVGEAMLESVSSSEYQAVPPAAESLDGLDDGGLFSSEVLPAPDNDLFDVHPETPTPDELAVPVPELSQKFVYPKGSSSIGETAAMETVPQPDFPVEEQAPFFPVTPSLPSFVLEDEVENDGSKDEEGAFDADGFILDFDKMPTIRDPKAGEKLKKLLEEQKADDNEDSVLELTDVVPEDDGLGSSEFEAVNFDDETNPMKWFEEEVYAGEATGEKPLVVVGSLIEDGRGFEFVEDGVEEEEAKGKGGAALWKRFKGWIKGSKA